MAVHKGSREVSDTQRVTFGLSREGNRPGPTRCLGTDNRRGTWGSDEYVGVIPTSDRRGGSTGTDFELGWGIHESGFRTTVGTAGRENECGAVGVEASYRSETGEGGGDDDTDKGR